VNRRALWVIATTVALAAAVVSVWRLTRPAPVALAATPDQNVLVVTIDTLRADALGCYGGRAATPNLDRLAASGARFDFAHAHAVVTLPSHASILTGLYPFQHGIRDNSGYRLAPDVPTLATRLGAQGYATAAFIAAFVLDSRFGLNTGFEVYDDRLASTDAPTDISMPERRADIVVAAAQAWIAKQPGRWFAWVHLFDPHAPYAPPSPFDGGTRPYDGEVAFTDAQLGSLLDAVRGVRDRPTLVIVTSDHGEALGDHGETTHGLFAYEATLRVPLIVTQVGGDRRETRAGAVSPAPVRHVDLVPTVLDALGLDAPAGLPGRSILPLLRGADAVERVSYFEAMSASLNRGWAPLRGVLAGREKLIDLPVPELFDLETDPEEHANLADGRPGRRRALDALLSGFQATLPDERRAESRDVGERLRALGYVSGTAPRKERYSEADDPKTLVEIVRAIHRGVDLIERRRFAEAVEVYRGILAERPDIALAYRHLAYLQWSGGDVHGAVDTIRRALRAGVAEPSLQVQLGTYLAEIGATSDAIPLLEGAARARPDDVEALNALGIAYARSGRLEAALKTFDAVLAIDPDEAMALQNAGAAELEQGDLDRARRRFTRALEVDAGLSQAYTGLGVVEMKSGRRREAVAAWTRAVEINPREFDALYNLALELINQGQVVAARPYVERFVRTAPPAMYGREIQDLVRRVEGR
jgi:arylsulfatase A-like enzyme/tetratricopeptide (TPR) repeat protein